MVINCYSLLITSGYLRTSLREAVAIDFFLNTMGLPLAVLNRMMMFQFATVNNQRLSVFFKEQGKYNW